MRLKSEVQEELINLGTDVDEQKKAAALYTQAGDYQKTARFYYKKAEDTYYQANNWASYDDWRRARDQWDYFYSRNR